MKLIALIFLSLALAGCACDPVYVDRPVEVKVPVPVPCVESIPEEPQWALDAPGLAERGLFTMGLAALQEVEQRRQYELKLRSTLEACKK